MAFSNFIRKLKPAWLVFLIRRRLLSLLAFVVALGSIAVGAQRFSDPFVRIPGGSLQLALNCMTEQVDIKSGTPYASIRASRLVVQDPGTARSPQIYDLSSSFVTENGKTVVSLALQNPIKDEFIKFASTIKNPDIRLEADFVQLPFLHLDEISLVKSSYTSPNSCASASWKGQSIKERVIWPTAKVIYFDQLQEKISDWIYPANESLGNFLIAVLMVAALWCSILLAMGFMDTSCYSDKYLRRKLKQRFESSHQYLQQKGMSAIIQADYKLVQQRLAFAKVIGPAIGFFMTVSSLIAGLHPSAQIQMDTFIFVSSLQIALVATFMGLLVRIIAELAVRAQRTASERKLILSMEGDIT